ncbi:MAG TPA: hypothetical protein VHG28_16720, partial [Longimicrobiaceae bacterium]|nr:hypothetical protein [Longimicrobiaceae bacterium]
MPWDRLTPGIADGCGEAVYVMTHSSSHRHIDPGVASEMMAGRRSRSSFAPMVILTGNLMA